MSFLNKAQLSAVKHEGGPLLIVAGAGTGKTTVMTERIRYLVEEKKVDPYAIFGTTFTDKAAGELENRLDQVMPYSYRAPWIGTFHSVCERILRQEALEIGLSPNFTIMTRTDAWMLIKAHLYEFELDYYRPLGNPTKFIDALITFFGRLSDEDVDMAQFAALVSQKQATAETDEEVAESRRLKELLGAFSLYQSLKQNEKKMDFSDLISQTLALFRNRPNVLNRYQKQFNHLLIDEFQDTNIAQFELIKLLAPPEANPNLVVVGDDNQSIYKFRSASVSNILQFMDLYPQAKQVVLSDNYRSTQLILDGAYQSISQNNPDTLEVKLGINKRLLSQVSDKLSPVICRFETQSEEVAWTVAEINRLVTQEKVDYQQIAILARANAHLDAYVTALQAVGIPFQRVANGGLYDQPIIANLIVALKVITDPTDSLNLYSLLNIDWFDLNKTDLLDQLINSKTEAKTLWELLQLEDKYQQVVGLINRYREMATTAKVSELLRRLIEEKQLVAQLVRVDSIDNQLAIKNLNLFFKLMKQFEMNNQQAGLPFFLETFEAWEEAGDNPGQAQLEDVDVVTLSTVHKAKGLEYEAVFVASMLAGRFPGSDRKDKILVPEELIKERLNSGDEHLQEERRLFYVAITRAKRFLYLTLAIDMGGAKKWRPSGFLAETGFETKELTAIKPLMAEKADKIEALRPKRPVINRISYSKIDAFRACPLRFKYAYIDKVPTFNTPQAQYGTAVHQTLFHLHLAEKQHQEVTLTELQQELAGAIERIVLDEKPKALMAATATRALAEYYQHGREQLGKPAFLEEPFGLRLDNGGLVTGKIDRIDQLEDGSFSIVDYKTGEVKDQTSVDKDEQLTLYALAVREGMELNTSNLKLYFFNRNQAVTTERSQKKLDNYKKKLEKTFEEIQTSNFEPTPSERNCSFCEFIKICPFVVKKRA